MFAMGIIGGLTGKEAAIKAGYSEKTAHVIASRMLSEVKFKHIQQFINLKMGEVVKKYEFDLDEHIRDQIKVAKTNLLDFVDPDTGAFYTDLRKVPYELGYLMSSAKTKSLAIKTVEGGEEISLPVLDVEFKLWDKMKAQDNLNRIHSLYKDKVEHTGVLAVKIVDDVEGE